MGVENGSPFYLGVGDHLRNPHNPRYQLNEDEKQAVEGLIQQGQDIMATPEDRLEYIEDLRFAIAYDSLLPPEERDYRSIAINREALKRMGMSL